MKKSRVLGRFFKKNACIIVFVMIMFLLTFAFSHIVAVSASGYNGITIVLDAGHGGVDVKLGQYVFSKKTTYFLDMWLFLIYKQHYRLYTSGLLQIHL